MLLAQLTIDWTNGLVIAAIGMFVVKEGINALKARGIDLKKQNDQIDRMHRIMNELEPFKMKRHVEETHDAHLGGNAVEGNGALKWYNDREHEKKMLQTQEALLKAVEISVACQKQATQLLTKLVDKE